MLDALLSSVDLSRAVAAAIRGRDAAFNIFFTRCARDLGSAARAIEERVHRNGRVYCFGRGIYSLDAADFAAALPAADVSRLSVVCMYEARRASCDDLQRDSCSVFGAC
jgi:hypothetical protein